VVIAGSFRVFIAVLRWNDPFPRTNIKCQMSEMGHWLKSANVIVMAA